MRKRIKRLSAHQNGKVFGVLIAIATMPMFIPLILIMAFTPSEANSGDNLAGFSSIIFIIFPLIYLVFGYISVALMCFIYNILQKITGGFEYETDEIVANRI